ncbi:MAG: tetratricopeptide repeat protein [Melioribacteraceae bacterium]|jgi:outer membrane protein assembly factor BamD (BamD/ComL family)|nr:tetratricopeptide repeat protein [Melioribacteraceae bacterium]
MRKNLLLFSLLTFLFNFCSSVNDQELFDKAQQDLNDKKYVEAVEGFEMLAAEAPRSDYAPQGLFECAKIYHMEQIVNLPKEESLKKAVEYYKRIYEGYPDFKESASAMMMTGFILANELNKTDEAKTVYEEFLKKYPDDTLAGSVKLELESIGLTPDEILQRKLEGTK